MTALSADSPLVIERVSGFSTMTGDFGSGELTGTFYKGALVAYDTNDSKIKPAATSTTLVAIGRYDGVQSDAGANVRSGIFSFVNSAAADEITNAEAGSTCYIVDDATVAKTDGTSTRSVAGIVHKVTADGRVEVAINPYS